MKVSDVAKGLIKLSDQKKKLKEELSFIQGQIDEKEAELLVMMTNEQVDKLSVAGRTLYPKINLYASLNKENKLHSMEWLRHHELSALIIETVNARTLASAVKAGREDGVVFPEDLFNVNEKTTIGIRKA